jgi:hypothetical protein
MPSIARARPEADRIDFLLRRDGYEATRTWVARTLGIYRDALRVSGVRGDSYYAPLFAKSIEEFEEWLAQAERPVQDAPAAQPRQTPGPPDTRNLSP